MSRRPFAFRQTDLTRALKGARAAGIEIGRFVIDKDGRITVVAAKTEEESANICGSPNEWDAVK